MRKNIVHIITGLNNGGAEAMLYKLLRETNQEKYNVTVISMLDEGVMGSKIEILGIKILCLRLSKFNFVQAFKQAIDVCRQADIIQCWMYHANLFGYIVNLFCHKKLIWGIRRGHLIQGQDKPMTIMIAKICAKLSGNVDKIIYCAKKSKIFHEHIGYSKQYAQVIPNGFDLEQFYRRGNEGEQFRLKEGIPSTATMIAFVGRYDTVKGYDNFIKAFSRIKDRFDKNNLFAVCAGTQVDTDNKQLVELIEQYGIKDSVKLLGRRDDISVVLSAADFFVSASYTEAFSNAIGEAMACELPCVVTDVGDSAYIVDDTGIVVENNNVDELVNGIRQLFAMSEKERAFLGRGARCRIKKLFDIKAVVKQYEELYEQGTKN
ncbi:MAG: glycosyltransferase [Anaerovorax sp.]|nr:glycosyltransferase [Anaerovorax sp.]